MSSAPSLLHFGRGSLKCLSSTWRTPNLDRLGASQSEHRRTVQTFRHTHFSGATARWIFTTIQSATLSVFQVCVTGSASIAYPMSFFRLRAVHDFLFRVEDHACLVLVDATPLKCSRSRPDDYWPPCCRFFSISPNCFIISFGSACWPGPAWPPAVPPCSALRFFISSIIFWKSSPP